MLYNTCAKHSTAHRCYSEQTTHSPLMYQEFPTCLCTSKVFEYFRELPVLVMGMVKGTWGI